MASPRMAHPRELTPDFEVARRLHKKHGTSYYFATKLFPRETRLATFALYAFFRVPDEIVDNSPINNAHDLQRVKNEIAQWRDKWRAAYETHQSDDPILRVTTYVFHRYGIPYEYSEAFLAAMVQDLEKSEYATYAELEEYMYGSAAVVGLMMSHVIGFRDNALRDDALRDDALRNNALEHAKQLGYAMQLTNFLRDIDEDYQERGRVYMPQDELTRFGLSTRDIAEQRFSPAFKEFMQWQSERARALYAEADKGVPLLQKHGRFPVRVAAALYSAILGKIAQQNYNVFEGRARTKLHEKLLLTARVLRS
ncbi:MAG TPA: phytoene/squalene synthase family protein [Abditibacteriaceae bacterium]